MPLPPIDDFNTFPDKTSGGNPAVSTDVVSAQDLNRIKLRMSENRTQANAAIAAPTAWSPTPPDAERVIVTDGSGGVTDTADLTVDSVTAPDISGIDGVFTGVLVVGGNAGRLLVSTGAEADFQAPATFDEQVTFNGPVTGVATSAQLIAAEALARNALSPTVPPVAQTAATRTLAATDAGDIIRSNGASNAIAYTIDTGLFESGGSDCAFVCQIKVVSVAGGALTFVGGGGVVLSYYGKNPGTTPYAADDYLTVVVDSATTASVFCASPAP